MFDDPDVDGNENILLGKGRRGKGRVTSEHDSLAFEARIANTEYQTMLKERSHFAQGPTFNVIWWRDRMTHFA